MLRLFYGSTKIYVSNFIFTQFYDHYIYITSSLLCTKDFLNIFSNYFYQYDILLKMIKIWDEYKVFEVGLCTFRSDTLLDIYIHKCIVQSGNPGSCLMNNI